MEPEAQPADPAEEAEYWWQRWGAAKRLLSAALDNAALFQERAKDAREAYYAAKAAAAQARGSGSGQAPRVP